MLHIRKLLLIIGTVVVVGITIGSPGFRDPADATARTEFPGEPSNPGSACNGSAAQDLLRSAEWRGVEDLHGVIAAGPVPDGALYVSPQGRDDWTGTLPDPTADFTDGPFATLNKARDSARARTTRTIIVRGGDYYLEGAVEFDDRDTGLVIMAASGERPILHGGIRLLDWTRDHNGIWSAPLNLPGGLTVGDFFVGSDKQVEARHPNRALHGGIREGWLFALAPSREAGAWSGNTQFRFRDGDLPELGDTTSMVVNIVGGGYPGSQWGNDILPVVSVDHESNTIHTQGTGYFFTGEGSRYFLAGSKRFLDAPGEWWYDKVAGRLNYIPADEGFNGSDTFAGVLPTLIRLDGATEMIISGLTLVHGAPQGSGKIGTDTRGFGAIRLEHSDMVKLIGNVICDVGVGIHVSESDDVVIAANEIGHTAGNGIYLGTSYGSFHPSDRAQIIGNHIYGVSEVFFEAAGLWFQATSGTRVAYNLIENAAQFGIAGGSLWGRQDACYNNTIEYNIVRGANQQTADGGAIKMMGVQGDRQNSVIRYNLVTGTGHLMNRPDGTFWPAGSENVREWPSPISWAIYTDGMASGITIEHNFILANISGIGLNGGWNNVISGNVIVGGTGTAFRVDDGTGRTWHPEWARPNRFERNVAVIDRKTIPAVHVNAPGHGIGYVEFARNLYWGALSDSSFQMSSYGTQRTFSGSLADFQRVGEEIGSVIADPLLLSPLSDGAVFRHGSPVRELGVPNIPVARMGPAGSGAWKDQD